MPKWAVKYSVHDESGTAHYALKQVDNDERPYVEESGGYVVYAWVFDTEAEATEFYNSRR